MPDHGSSYDTALASAVASFLEMPWEPLAPEEIEKRCDWLADLRRPALDLWVRNSPHVQHPLVVRQLARRAYDLRIKDPGESLELADRAVQVASALTYPREFETYANDLRAEALGIFANSLRLAEKYGEADEVWKKCEEARLDGTCDQLLFGELMRHKAALRIDQRQLGEALELYSTAAGLLLEIKEFHRAGKARLAQAITYFEAQEPGTALDTAALAGKLIDPRKEPEMGFALMHNTLFFLEAFKLPNAALSLFNRLRPMYGDMDSPLINTRALWLSGRLFFAVGRYRPAAKYSEAARKAFLDHGLAYDAALAGFDSARAWAHLGNTLQVQLIAGRMYEVFTDKDIPGEAMKALEIFVDAAQRAEADVALMARLADQLAKSPRP